MQKTNYGDDNIYNILGCINFLIVKFYRFYSVRVLTVLAGSYINVTRKPRKIVESSEEEEMSSPEVLPSRRTLKRSRAKLSPPSDYDKDTGWCTLFDRCTASIVYLQ